MRAKLLTIILLVTFTVTLVNSQSEDGRVNFERNGTGSHIVTDGRGETLYEMKPSGKVFMENIEFHGFFQKNKCGPGEAIKKVNPDGSYLCGKLADVNPGSSNNSNHSGIGGKMKENLDMNGNSIEDLRLPDDRSDAATKGYVDSRVSVISNISQEDVKGYASKEYVNETLESFRSSLLNNYSLATDSYVDRILDSNVTAGSDTLSLQQNVSQPIEFENGVELGNSGTEAVEGAAAIGNDAEALADNSVALGDSARVNRTDTLAVGDESDRMDLEVSGDLRVEGEIEQSEPEKNVWSYSFAVDRNGTEVKLPLKLVNSSYSVSVTPVDSLARTGVFNKSSESFYVKASEFTEVDVIITE